MVDARSLRTIAAAFQNEMNDRATVVATTTLVVVEVDFRDSDTFMLG